MKISLNVAGAATLTLLASGVFGPAGGEEAFQASPQMDGFSFCSAGPQSDGCMRFQGYIYAGRAATEAAPPARDKTPDPKLGDERLYIHLRGADAR
jgi:hypothetical protein